MLVNPKRIRILDKGKWNDGPIVYWTSRDQRVKDNWALLFAIETAAKRGVPLAVAFCLVPEFLGAASRQYRFMLQGLRDVESRLKSNKIPFCLLADPPEKEIPRFISEHKIGALITDFDPLRKSEPGRIP